MLCIVPMFHAMGWNLPFVAGLNGADLVMPGRFLQSPYLARLIEEERVTYTARRAHDLHGPAAPRRASTAPT